MSAPAIATRPAQPSGLKALQRRFTRVLATLPDWALMTWMALTTAALDLDLAFGVKAPMVFGDEATYASLARKIADHHVAGVLAAARSGYGVVYPALLAPAFAVASAPTAYSVAKGLNAVLLASSVFPVFLLARRVLPRRWAVVATIVATVGPQAVFSALLMTENVSFPLFIWSMLCVVRMLERPSRLNQLVALGSVVLCITTRMQAVVFVPGLALAIGTCLYFDASDRARRLRLFKPVWVGLAIACLAGLAYLAAKGSSAAGAYTIVLTHGYSPLGTARWLAGNLADLDLLFGFGMFAIAPFAAARAFRGSGSTASSRAIAATLTGFGLPSLLLVAAFSSSAQGGHREHERYLMYFVPLVVVLCLRWITSGEALGRRALIVSAAVAAALPATLPLEDMRAVSWIDSFGAEPWLNAVLPSDYLRIICVGVALAVSASVVLSSGDRRRNLLLTSFVAASFLSFTSVGAHAHDTGRYAVQQLDWIDRAVGPGNRVEAVYVGRPCRTVFQQQAPLIRTWRAAFFNRRLHLTYFVGARMPNEVESRRLAVRGGRTLAGGHPVSPRYVLVPSSVDVAGTVLARAGKLKLVEASAPLELRLPHWAGAGACSVRS